MFNRANKSLLLLSLGLAWSCTGDFTPVEDPRLGGTDVDPGEVNTGGENGAGGNLVIAKDFYEANIDPLMKAKCSACHAGEGALSTAFLTEINGSSYNTILAYNEITGGFGLGPATLLTKGAHSGSQWWDDGEVALIQQWFDAEKAAAETDEEDVVIVDPGEEPGEAPVAIADGLSLMKEWSGCMTLDNWEEANMGSWANKPAEDNKTCQDCHSDGLLRFNTDPDSSLMFTFNRYQLYMIGFFSQEFDPADGSGMMVPNIPRLVRAGNGTTGHPEYNTNPNDLYMQRLQEFYELTLETKENGECGPAQFPQQ